jgi:hypothetical protein
MTKKPTLLPYSTPPKNKVLRFDVEAGLIATKVVLSEK